MATKKRFLLLHNFASLFNSAAYLHRNSTQCDIVAQYLYEDLALEKPSRKLAARIEEAKSVLNSANRAHGIRHRRGDGSLGTLVPGDEAVRDPGFLVARGPIAHVEMGVEVKILAKAMIKQIDRVKNDLRNQAAEFRRTESQAITIAIVGVNHAEQYRSFEGEREFLTDGRKYKHPQQEAAAAIARLAEVEHAYDELLILPFIATNLEPYQFSWVDQNKTRQDYASLLVRVARLYESRF